MKKKILFITKNFPPQTGGMENYCFDLYTHLSKHYKIFLIANKWGTKGLKGKVMLPVFGVIALLKGLLYAPQVDVIYVGDGSISIYGVFFRFLFGNKILITIYGLDMTWENRLYQKLIVPMIRSYDHIISISDETTSLALNKGIPKEKITLITPGITTDKSYISISKKNLFEKYEIDAKYLEADMLFSIGRRIERKGFHWFIESILPKLNKDNYIYILASGGPYESTYRELIKNHKLQNFYLVGKISDDDKISFLQHSDVFIMPNIRVPGDKEGFGIVAIEAGLHGCPTFASNIEGMKNAVIDGKTGIKIEDDENRMDTRVNLINEKKYNDFDKSDITKTIIKEFHWDQLIALYIDIINSI